MLVRGVGPITLAVILKRIFCYEVRRLLYKKLKKKFEVEDFELYEQNVSQFEATDSSATF